MDDFSNLVLASVIHQTPRTKPTAFENLNEILNGGFPRGRLIEIYGRSQIGKSSLALSLFPNEPLIYLDLARKLCTDYASKEVLMAPNVQNDKLFEMLLDIIHEDIVIVIDDLTMLGTMRDDNERFKWLMRNFMIVQRELVTTESLIIVLNQIRIAPNTGKSYNPHEGCLDPAIKIKLHYAERKKDGDLVYLDVEKHFWGKEGARCTLLVSKNSVQVPSFYRPQSVTNQESEL